MASLSRVVLILYILVVVSPTLAMDPAPSLPALNDTSVILPELSDSVLGGALSLLAGNPGSLQTQAVENAYAVALDGAVDALEIVLNEDGDISNLFGFGFTVGEYEVDGIKTSYIRLPLTYTLRSQRILGRQWIVSLPLSAGEVNGAKTYSIQPGLALRLPVTGNWALTPGLNIGYVKSNDLDQEAEQAGVSVSSSYRIPLRATGNSVYIGNFLGYYKTLKVDLAGNDFDPNLANTVFRNGLLYSMPLAFANELLSVELSLVNTIFKGSETYTRSQNELAVSLGSPRRHMAQRSFLRIGLSVVRAEDITGLRLNFGYYF